MDTMFVALLMACAGTNCSYMSGDFLVATEKECHAQIYNLSKSVPKNATNLYGACIPVKMTRV